MREGFEIIRDCRRLGYVPTFGSSACLDSRDFTRCYAGGVVGDIGVSVSQPIQNTSSAGAGDFTVGGKKKDWLWPLAILVIGTIGILAWFKRKKP